VLDQETFTWVAATYAADLDAAHIWATDLIAAATIDASSIAARMLDRYDQCATDAELVVATRATQVALFRLGWFVQVDHAHLVGTAAHEPRRAQRDDTWWRRLAVYREPYRGAICALAATGGGSQDMLAVTCRDVAADGSTVQIGDQLRPIETGARVYLRAMRTLRQLQADGNPPLLANTSGETLRPRIPGDVLKAARVTCGAALVSRLMVRNGPDRFGTQWGVSVQSLTPVSRAAAAGEQ
jgi:hypothetical protein